MDSKPQQAKRSGATAFSVLFASATYAYCLWVFTAFLFWSGSITLHAGDILPEAVHEMFPWNIDASSKPSGPAASGLTAGLVLGNLWPLAAFFTQHMVMARRTFKSFVTKHLYPEAIERSVFVLASCTCLLVMFIVWQPMPAVVWDTPEPMRPLVWAAFVGGFGLVFLSSFMFDHFELFGISQGFGWKSSSTHFRTPYLYQWIRHPIMTGTLVAFWSAPTMTLGRLLFALLNTGFVLLDVKYLEERDLKHVFPGYEDYSAKVGSFCPWTYKPYSRTKTEAGNNATDKRE